MSAIEKLHVLGQSVWYDNIQRSLLEDGTLAGMIGRREIFGVTSNPSIFKAAITGSSDYDDDLQTMSWAGLDSEAIFYQLAVKDIQDAADLFRSLYESTNGADGYVSLEVNPNLAYDTAGTIAEAKSLWAQVDRPNLMIKIPATKEGLPAITAAIAEGINVNVTLIFSRQRYLEVMEAYLAGLEKRLDQKKDISGIASVASFFVSRLETKVDLQLQAMVDTGGSQAEKARSLLGRLAVANTRLAYRDYEEIFSSPRFQKLSSFGARKQRPLWASTSTKNADYSDVKYVESLVAENTVNTIPPKTLQAFLDHGSAAVTIYEDLESAEEAIEALDDLGISLEAITQNLEEEGVQKFADAFDALLRAIDQRKAAFEAQLGPLASAVRREVQAIKKEEMALRINKIDPTVWTNDPAGKNEIQKRLGWLSLPETSRMLIPGLASFAADCKAEGYEKVLLLGMGGSSLAPETMSRILADALDGLELIILDSTIPAQVAAAEAWADFEKTLFIVASKSGTTSETLTYYRYFWNRAQSVLGEEGKDHFIAITDPGSKLAEIGQKAGFRAVFTAMPNVGGRYSALSDFGLVPAALMGVHLARFLGHAEDMADRCSPSTPLETNPGAMLGVVLAAGVKAGRDKLTLLMDPPYAPLGAWLEQLIAESSGKSGTGIVPVADEPLIDAGAYGADRLFVYVRTDGSLDEKVDALLAAGQPAITLTVESLEQLAASFYRWEMAIAFACGLIGVNAFDQPDVQDNKNRTRDNLAVYETEGKLEERDPIWEKKGVKIYGLSFETDLSNYETVRQVMKAFIEQAKKGDYVALNAYLPRNTENLARLTHLRQEVLKMTGCATTLGFGPRFLHSTGQLHKGGPDSGLFIQITQDDAEDIDVPGASYTFGVLARAQAQGDLDALLARGRRVIRIHLPKDMPDIFSL
jgi:transaldolase/glucose-6-phosphate isomerase